MIPTKTSIEQAVAQYKSGFSKDSHTIIFYNAYKEAIEALTYVRTYQEYDEWRDECEVIDKVLDKAPGGL